MFLLARLFLSQDADLKPFFATGLFVKILAGIGVGLVYTYYYSAGDTFGFFNDAQTLSSFLKKAPGKYFDFLIQGDRSYALADELLNSERRSLFLVKNLSLISMLSFNNYWVTSVAFSTVSFLGCWYAFRKITDQFPEGKWAAILSFLLVPSFVFWSSGIIKESLSIAALMFLVGFIVQLLSGEKNKLWEWIVALTAVVFLWKLKYYWAALFMPAAVTTILLVRFIIPVINSRNKAYEVLLWLIIFGFIVLGASNIHPNFYLSRFLNVVVENHNAYVIASVEGPVVNFHNLESTWGSILVNSPWALFSGLFRPFVMESGSVFQMVIALENLLLLGLCLFNIRYITRAWHSNHRLLIISVGMYICLLAIFLTLSTPNFGTLSRYRVGFLPFFFFLLLYYPSQLLFEKINKLKIR